MRYLHTRAAAFAVAITLTFGSAPAARAQEAATQAAPASAAERLAGAVRIRTVSYADQDKRDPAALLALHAYCAETFPRVHASLTLDVVNDYSLLYTWTGADPRATPFLLTSHFDVVPVPDDTRDEWVQPPFDGVIADGFIWGRGTLDNKSGVFATLEAVEGLLADGYTPKHTVYLAFGHDEEVGGPEGAAKITELLQERGVQVGWSLDEGMAVMSGIMPGVQGAVALIGVAEKGSCTLTLTAHAPGGHSSMPPAESAIGRLARAIQRVEANPMPARLDDGTAAAMMFDAVGPHMEFPLSTIIAYRWLFKPILVDRLSKSPATNAMIRTTTAVTIIRGGVKSNVLPGKATATVNFRLLPGDTVETVVAHVRQAIADPEIDIEAQPGRDASAVSSAEAPGYLHIQHSLEQTMPDLTTVALGLMIAGTDSKHYSKIADNSYRFVPMRLGKDDTKRFHGVNERIAVDNYDELIAFYAALIRNAAG